MDDSTARESYNTMSRVYGWLSDGSEKRFVKEAVEGLLKPQPGETVLEPGFGTGQVLLALAEMVGPSGRAYGIDISDGMVEQTTRRLQKHGMLERCDIRRGDATAMPYDDDTFDAVFMSFTLELFSDEQIPVVLSEVARVLKPTGRLCVACMSSRGGDAAMENLYVWSHEHFPTFVDCRPIDGPARVSTAGFTVTEVRSMSMWGLAVDLILAHRPAG